MVYLKASQGGLVFHFFKAMNKGKKYFLLYILQ